MSAKNEQSTSEPGRPASKPLGIHDLEKLRISIPPGALPPGIMLVVILTASGSQSGYIDQTQMPALYPLADLTRLNGVPKMIGTGEAVDNRSRQGDIVKIVAQRVSRKDAPNFGPGAPKAIGDAIALSLVLKQNINNLAANVSQQPYSSAASIYLKEQGAATLTAIDSYIDHQTTSGGLKKTLRDFVDEVPGLPMWVFTHLTTKGWIPDSPHDSIAELIFPKNVSKGIALRLSEWRQQPMLDALGPLLMKSRIIVNISKAATLDALIGTHSKARGVKGEAALLATYLPLLPPWDLKDNVLKKRTSNPTANREGDLAPLSNLIGRIFATSVGTRPRSLTQKTFWTIVAGFTPDNTNPDPGTSQWRESEHFKTLDPNEAPLDKALLNPADSEAGSLVQLNFFLTDMVRTDSRFAALVALSDLPAYEPGWQEDIVVNRDGIRALCAALEKYEVKTSVDRARGTVTLALTDEEQKLIANPLWTIKEGQKKERRFPVGDAPTESAAQLLSAIRPHGTDRTLDRHFSGLYSLLTELFSSFNHPAVTNRAVGIVRATMSRLKGEGLFFSSDALTGVGGELFTANGNEQLFADI